LCSNVEKDVNIEKKKGREENTTIPKSKLLLKTAAIQITSIIINVREEFSCNLKKYLLIIKFTSIYIYLTFRFYHM